MYIEIIRKVVDSAIITYADSNQTTVPSIHKQIKKHIDRTTSEYRNNTPDINYEDPLCRLGYLYRHGPANANLFNTVLSESDSLTETIRHSCRRTLNVCAAGGGPGTELLGLAKYLNRRPRLMPRKVVFSVLANVSEWADTWDSLAEEVEDWFSSHPRDDEVDPPIVSPAFLTLNVLDPSSYQNYGFKFRKADVVVFNYLFSENKNRLDQAHPALDQLVKLTPDGCKFIVIDRKENDPTFHENVIQLFETVLGEEITLNTYNGTIDGDERADDMGQELLTAFGSPRLKFFTDQARDATVFWFVTERKMPLSEL